MSDRDQVEKCPSCGKQRPTTLTRCPLCGAGRAVVECPPVEPAPPTPSARARLDTTWGCAGQLAGAGAMLAVVTFAAWWIFWANFGLGLLKPAGEGSSSGMHGAGELGLLFALIGLVANGVLCFASVLVAGVGFTMFAAGRQKQRDAAEEAAQPGS